jgi:4-hydroxy-tetrahydrodipicolinate synthase
MPDFPKGVFCAALTPLNADTSPDHSRLVEHCQRLLAEGCTGVALLGTTGEANSFSTRERMAMLEAVVGAGVDPTRLLPGTGVCALPETVELTAHARSLGVRTVIMLPPFYYKDITDDGLFAAYSQVIDSLADDGLQVILYHIPPISKIPLSVELVGRLRERFPHTIAGVKDSSGDFDNMAALTAAYPDLSIFAGADPLMLPLLKQGGAGCITATSNILAAPLRYIFDHHADGSAAAEVTRAQEHVGRIRALTARWPQMATIKAMLAHLHDQPGWNRLRPPLLPLTPAQRAEFEAAMAETEIRFA